MIVIQPASYMATLCNLKPAIPVTGNGKMQGEIKNVNFVAIRSTSEILFNDKNNTRYENDVFSVSDTGGSQLESSL